MRTTLPERIDRDHPLMLSEYAVYTPPIDEMVETIGDWIDRRVAGGYIYGASRFGKSRGVKFFVQRELEVLFKNAVPLVIWVRPTDVQMSEAGFWHELLNAGSFAFINPRRPKPAAEGRYLVQERFITIARQARSNYIVLIIDEAHDVTYKEWKWLTSLQNKLDWLGFRLSVFSVGTQQLAYEHSLMGKSGNAHVAARFMVENARFHGIRTVDELRYVLNGYDHDSEWPKGSKVSYHQYFSPAGFSRGERLADTAENMWSALCEAAPRATEFPMKHIALAVETVLDELAVGEKAWSLLTSQSGWRDAIAKSSLQQHMKLVTSAA